MYLILSDQHVEPVEPKYKRSSVLEHPVEQHEMCRHCSWGYSRGTVLLESVVSAIHVDTAPASFSANWHSQLIAL